TISRRSTTVMATMPGTRCCGSSPRGFAVDTRGIDLACRLGGEEFVVMMPDCDLAKAYQVGERLRQCIEAAPFEVGGKVGLLQVTASVGVGALELDDGAPEHVLKRAYEALYCAKRDGRTGLWPTQPRGLRPRQSAESPTDFRC